VAQREKNSTGDRTGQARGGRATDAAPATGRFAYEGLHRLLHERARLSILSSLASHADGLPFNDLKALCSLTDGNLSRQLQILQEAGLLEVTKGVKNNRPHTHCRLTPQGRERFLEYIAVLESVVSDAVATRAQDERHAPQAARPRVPGGLSPT
jgi:DNA-binding HxlR family transcriptional regulator